MIAKIPGILDNIFSKTNQRTGEVKEVLQIAQTSERGEKILVNVTTDDINDYASRLGERIEVECKIGLMVLDNGKPLQTIKAL